MRPRALPVVVRAGAVGRALAGLVAGLVGLSLAGTAYAAAGGPLGDYARWAFALDRERALPTWVSVALLLAAAALLAVTARAEPTRWRRAWAALAVVFAGLSLDEAVSIHELASEPVRTWLGVGGPLYFGWVVPGAAVVAVVGAACVPFLASRPRWLRRRLVAAGAVYVGGAWGLELVGGALYDAGLADSAWAVAVWTAEEGAELAGVALLIHALLLNLERAGARFDVRFGPGPDERRGPSGAEGTAWAAAEPAETEAPML